MGYASETGYVPSTIAELMDSVRVNVNAQFGTSYVTENFVGTNFYKYFYSIIQDLQKNEVKTAEIFIKMQEYFSVTNEMILRPNTTHPGIFDYFGSKGFFVSTKPPLDADAGKLFVCVDVDDNHARGLATITSYANLLVTTPDTIRVGATVFTAQSGAATLGTATFRAATSNDATALSLAAQINAHATAGALVLAVADGAIVRIRAKTGGTAGNSILLAYTDNGSSVGATVSGANLAGGNAIAAGTPDYDTVKLTVNNLVKDCCAAGIVSQGTEVSTITLANGQAMDFKFNLPNRIPVLIRVTIAQSENNLFKIDDPAVTRQKAYDNIVSQYRLGKNFEPQRYFSILDAPWAMTTLLEWSSDNGATWHSTVYDANYDDLFTFALTDISIVET